jgi:hypothetical protein
MAELYLFTAFTVFKPSLWVMLFVTSIVVGGLVWIVDTVARNLLKPALRSRPRSSSEASGRSRRRQVLERFRPWYRRRSYARGWAGTSSAAAPENAELADVGAHKFEHGVQQQDSGIQGAVRPCATPFSDTTTDACRDQQMLDTHCTSLPMHLSNETDTACNVKAANGNGVREPGSNCMDMSEAARDHRSHTWLRWLGVREGEEKEALKNLSAYWHDAFLQRSFIPLLLTAIVTSDPNCHCPPSCLTFLFPFLRPLLQKH